MQGSDQCSLQWRTLRRPVPVTWSACTWVFITYISFNPNCSTSATSLSAVLSTGSISCIHRLSNVKLTADATSLQKRYLKKSDWNCNVHLRNSFWKDLAYHGRSIRVRNICQQVCVCWWLFLKQLPKQQGWLYCCGSRHTSEISNPNCSGWKWTALFQRYWIHEPSYSKRLHTDWTSCALYLLVTKHINWMSPSACCYLTLQTKENTSQE